MKSIKSYVKKALKWYIVNNAALYDSRYCKYLRFV